MLKWRNGRRSGLKIRWPKGRAGSSPAFSTRKVLVFQGLSFCPELCSKPVCPGSVGKRSLLCTLSASGFSTLRSSICRIGRPAVALTPYARRRCSPAVSPFTAPTYRQFPRGFSPECGCPPPELPFPILAVCCHPILILGNGYDKITPIMYNSSIRRVV